MSLFFFRGMKDTTMAENEILQTKESDPRMNVLMGKRWPERSCFYTTCAQVICMLVDVWFSCVSWIVTERTLHCWQVYFAFYLSGKSAPCWNDTVCRTGLASLLSRMAFYQKLWPKTEPSESHVTSVYPDLENWDVFVLKSLHIWCLPTLMPAMWKQTACVSFCLWSEFEKLQCFLQEKQRPKSTF